MNEWNNLESMPGWTISGGGIWNGGMEIKVDDDFLGDDEVRSSENNTFLRFFTDGDNMWAAERAAQVVSVESGKTYKLECAVMGKNATKKDDGSEMDSEWKIRVCEIDKDATGTTIAGKELYVFDLTGDEMPGGWFEKRSFDVKATADKLWVEIYYVSWCDDGVNRDENGWFCIDDVDLYDPDGEFSTAIKNVNFDENEPIEYYTLGNGPHIAQHTSGPVCHRAIGYRRHQGVATEPGQEKRQQGLFGHRQCCDIIERVHRQGWFRRRQTPLEH